MGGWVGGLILGEWVGGVVVVDWMGGWMDGWFVLCYAVRQEGGKEGRKR